MIWQPDGFVSNGNDCYDDNKNAKPYAEAYFDEHRGDGSFDYNCDGDSKRAQIGKGSCSNGKANQGWNSTIPECGKKAEWLVDCDRKLKPLKIEVKRETEHRFQTCR